MSLWRKEAFERFAEFRGLLQQEKSAYNFLGELVNKLVEAYASSDDGRIRRIYNYAKWCLAAPPGRDASDDLPTIVTVSFYEHLPHHTIVRKDVGRWLPKEMIEGMKEVFLYHGTPEQYEEMLAPARVQKK